MAKMMSASAQISMTLTTSGNTFPCASSTGHAAALLPHVERRLVGRHPDAAAVMAGDPRSHLGGLHVDRVAVVPVERDPAEYLDAGHRGPQQIGDVVGDEIMALVHDPAIAVLLALPGQRQLVDAAGPDIGIGMYVHFDHAVEILVDGRRRGSGFAFQQAARHGKAPVRAAAFMNSLRELGIVCSFCYGLWNTLPLRQGWHPCSFEDMIGG